MNKGRRFTLKKEERVRGVKQIEHLFTHGQSFVAYPLRVVFVEQTGITPSQVSIFVSVPKKKLKSAVDRNRIKRLIREAYRLNKYTFDRSCLRENQTLAIAFVYLKNEMSDYETIAKSVRKALKEIEKQLKEREKC
jgi:ribonuclease P protein component